VENSNVKELLTRDFTIAPTSVFYDYLRDPMRRQQLEWHKDFSPPALLKGWEIGPGVHPGILRLENRRRSELVSLFL